MQQFIALGNLATAPIRKEHPSGTIQTNFKLAVNREGEDKGADFMWVATWGKQADAVATHLTKGSEVLVTGRLNSYQKRDDAGNIVSESLTVNARNVKFLRRPNGSTPTDAPEIPEELVEAAPAPGDDDIPF